MTRNLRIIKPLFISCFIICLLVQCNREPEEPRYGLRSFNQLDYLNQVLNELETLSYPDTADFNLAFDGHINGKEIQLRAKESDDFIDGYLKYSSQRTLRLVSSKPSIDLGNLEGAIPFVTIKCLYLNESSGVIMDLKWELPHLDTVVNEDENFWLDQVFTSFFQPGATRIPHTRESLDSTTIGLLPEFYIFLRGNYHNIPLIQKLNADDYRSMKCTSFNRTLEAEGIRYEIEFECRHGVGGPNNEDKPDFIPIDGTVRINHFEPF